MASAINATVPANSGSLSSTPIRENFAAAKSEIEALQTATTYQTGQIVYAPNAPAVTGWIECNGQAVLQSAYANLFAAIGFISNFEIGGYRLISPATTITAASTRAGWSSDDTYIVCCCTTGQTVQLYKRTGDTFTKLADPASQPAGQVNSADFNMSDSHFAAGMNISPYIWIYSRSGDVFTKIADPAYIPSSNVNAVEYNPVVNHLAAGGTGTVKLILWEQSGDTLTRITTIDNIPTQTVNDVAFSHDGNWLATASNTTDGVGIWKREGSTYTKQTISGGGATVSCVWAEFSPNNEYLAVASSGGEFVYLYQLIAGTWTKLERPTGLRNNATLSVSWSKCSKWLIATTSASYNMQAIKVKDGIAKAISLLASSEVGAITSFKVGKQGGYSVATRSTGSTFLFWKNIDCNIATEFVIPYNTRTEGKWIKT